MAVSDQLSRLSARAKEAEEHAAAARDKAKADLELDVENARSVGQAEAQRLGESAEASKGKISDWWNDVQRTWKEHVAAARKNIDSKKEEIDLDRAQAKAEHAEEDALFAIDYASAVIDETEYAVLDATLARKEADELAATGSSA